MRRAALVVWLTSIVSWSAAVVLGAYAPLAGANPVLEAVELFAFVILGTFGYLIVRRQPTNAVAWLAIIPGLVFPLEAMLSDVAHFALTSWGPDHWVTAVAGWCALWVWIPGPYSIPFLLALYPDGQPASPRWRPLLWLLWTLVALSFFISAFAPGPVDEVLLPGLNNPLGIAAFIPVAEALAPIVFNAIPIVSLIGVISLVFRFRSAGAVQRQQIKWLAWVGVVAVIFFAVTIPGDVPPLLSSFINIGFVILVGSTLFVAVTRLGLYEIDRLISRTLAYAIVAVVIAAAYLGGIAALGAIVGRDNPLAVAGATLAAAALFSPVRRRVQAWVDRRFDRARYDSEQVVAGFSARLRDQVELDGLTADLEGVVNRTLRPTITGVWLASTRGDA
ncbi:MAG TPA: hypothetical protein VHM94_11460 [Acidimicrobiia bacterium]|nr:hypothetical protein [Acidimicrobiia bacterium]